MTEPIASDKKSANNQSLYVADDKVYTRKIRGFYQRLRRFTGIPLLTGFLLCPWLVIDGRPAMLFDLPARKFYVFWLTFWPQDGMYLAWMLIISAFTLFTVTTLVGRVYCGFTCPQTVWTQMFIWFESLFQGDRNQRIKLDHQPWSTEKLVKKGATHFCWLAVAAITALTFVGYFTPIRQLIVSLVTFSAHPVAAFWVGFFTLATYLNAGFMREQVCKYMCPYARFQSVMYDKNTLAVRYDAIRGEPRGPRKPDSNYKKEGLGDCIDCSWCVQVCPTDIDIRDGMQYECIDCGLCVDACNSVMDKMGYSRGLIRYATEPSVTGQILPQKKSQNTGRRLLLRPRLLGYGTAVAMMVSLFLYSMVNRVPLNIDVVRDRGINQYRLRGDAVENVYLLKINNMDRNPHRYEVSVEGVSSYELHGADHIELEEGEVLSAPVRLRIPRAQLTSENFAVKFIVKALDNESLSDAQEARFIGPDVGA